MEKINWYQDYRKEAGMMDSIKGLFTSKPKQEVNQESAYIDKVVSSLKEFIELNKDKVKTTRDGKKKLAMWIWGNPLLKSLMEETPWDKNDTEMIGQEEQMKLFENRIMTVVEKLKSMGYNVALDYEGKKTPVDIEVFF